METERDGQSGRQGADNLEMLVTISRLLSSKLELGDLLAYVMRIAPRVAGSERATLYLLDPQTGELYFDIALGLDPDVQKLRFKPGEGLAGSCAAGAKSLVVNDAQSDTRLCRRVDAKSGYTTRSVMCCPMVIKGHVIGVLQAVNHLDGPFSEKDLHTFEALASQAAVAIENARLFTSLREEKRRLQLFFTSTGEGAVLTDSGGAVLLANDAAKAYLGGGAAADIAGVFSGMALRPACAGIMASSEPLVFFEAERGGGKKLFLEGSAIRLQSGASGGAACEGWLWVFRDVTAKRCEELLARNFLSLVSHKLRTPLTVINGYAQTMNEELGQDANPFIRKAAETIGLQGKKLTALVEQLLSFVALDDISAQSLERARIRPEELVEEALALFEHAQADDPGKIGTVRLKLDEMPDFSVPGLSRCAAPPLPPQAHALLTVSTGFEPGLPEIYGERGLLRKALENLVDNARKFNPGPDKQVGITVRALEGSVLFSVADNGCGIAPEEQARIFDKFYQVESSFSGQVEGWGIGLAFSKKAVEAHGGKIAVLSRPGQGSTFTVSLPVA